MPQSQAQTDFKSLISDMIERCNVTNKPLLIAALGSEVGSPVTQVRYINDNDVKIFFKVGGRPRPKILSLVCSNSDPVQYETLNCIGAIDASGQTFTLFIR